MLLRRNGIILIAGLLIIHHSAWASGKDWFRVEEIKVLLVKGEKERVIGKKVIFLDPKTRPARMFYFPKNYLMIDRNFAPHEGEALDEKSSEMSSIRLFRTGYEDKLLVFEENFEYEGEGTYRMWLLEKNGEMVTSLNLDNLVKNIQNINGAFVTKDRRKLVFYLRDESPEKSEATLIFVDFVSGSVERRKMAKKLESEKWPYGQFRFIKELGLIPLTDCEVGK